MSVIGAYMVPHPPLIIEAVGKGEERAIQNTIDAYKNAARDIGRLQPETIVITTPHSVMYSDYFHISPGTRALGSFAQFGAGEVRLEGDYDTAFVNELCSMAEERDFMAGTMGERNPDLDHATMIPMYFVNQYYQDYRIVRIGLSGRSMTDHYTLGTYIKEAAQNLNRRTVIIASGDLSHKLKEDGPYGFAKEGPEYDRKIMEIMATGQFEKLFSFKESFCRKASECGHRSFLIMAGALDKTQVKPEQLSYEGPFGVGYGICTYQVMGVDETRDFGRQYQEEERLKAKNRKRSEDDYVRLARRSLEYFVRSGRMLDLPVDLPRELLDEQAGVFVTIYKDEQLRGCIGTTSATKSSVAQEIITNAVSSASRDPRFEPVTKEELPELIYHVDVLGKTRPVSSADELDAKKYGVIVSKGYRRGLLLPNLEGVDTVEEQIAIAKQKAGIDPEESVDMECFQVTRHE